MKKILLLSIALFSLNSHAILMDDFQVDSAGGLISSTTSLPTALVLDDEISDGGPTLIEAAIEEVKIGGQVIFTEQLADNLDRETVEVYAAISTLLENDQEVTLETIVNALDN